MHTSTLTIRLPQDQRAALKETAKRLKKSESGVIRELLAREFEQLVFGGRAVEFMGCLEFSPAPAPESDSFRVAIRRANWRPA
jgi:hypothetical protein